MDLNSFDSSAFLRRIMFMAASERRKFALCRWPALAVLAAVHATGCTRETAEPAAASAVETVPLHVLARTIEAYPGRTIRTCGSELRQIDRGDGSVGWLLSTADPTHPYRFPASVIIRGCSDRAPRLHSGCVVGRVAQENGSLAPNPGARLVEDHEIINREWWLHLQCRRTRAH